MGRLKGDEGGGGCKLIFNLLAWLTMHGMHRSFVYEGGSVVRRLTSGRWVRVSYSSRVCRKAVGIVVLLLKQHPYSVSQS